MYLDQFGKIRACCQNTGFYLGDVTRQSLRQIWEGAEAESLRTALEADDYGAGCEFCEWQLTEGNEDILFARQFDSLRPDQPRLRWPRRMEFSVTNTCNLACTMCNGDWSSTIRAKREGRSPIPEAYDDDFFEELADFLPHLEEARFLGGEPFLGAEPLRIMEMLVELDARPQVSITTNGTIYTDRVRRILRTLEPSIVVSIDGGDTETYNAIRVGAHLPNVLVNLDRFRAAVGNDRVSITHCLMTTNWRGFAELLQIAEDRHLAVGVNVVRFPAELSLYQLTAEELEPIVETFENTVVELTGARLAAWTGHTTALANRLQALRKDPSSRVAGSPATVLIRTPSDNALPTFSRWHWLPFPEQDPSDLGPPQLAPDTWDVRLEIDTAGTVSIIDSPVSDFFGVALLNGCPQDQFIQWLRESFGIESTWEVTPRHQGKDENRLEIRFPATPQGTTRMRGWAKRDQHGTLTGVVVALDLEAVALA